MLDVCSLPGSLPGSVITTLLDNVISLNTQL